jgi:hypothetical protein
MAIRDDTCSAGPVVYDMRRPSRPALPFRAASVLLASDCDFNGFGLDAESHGELLFRISDR